MASIMGEFDVYCFNESSVDMVVLPEVTLNWPERISFGVSARFTALI